MTEHNNQKLRETFDVIFGGEDGSSAAKPARSGSAKDRPAARRSAPDEAPRLSGGPERSERKRQRRTTATTESETAAFEDGEGPRSPRPGLPADDVNRFVAQAEGGFFYPNFISDYLMRDLSLGEQAVFNRLLRLSQGIDEPTGKMKVRDVAEACGVTVEFAAKTIKSLQEKGIIRVLKRNPFTRSVPFQLDVMKRWGGQLVLCAVCHGPIRAGHHYVSVEIAKTERGVQEVLAHGRCVGE